MHRVRITVKNDIIRSGARLAKGCSVEITAMYPNPITSNGGKEVQDAFFRIYGFDLRKHNALSVGHLEVKKL